MWMVSFFIKIYWTIKKESKMPTRIHDCLCAEGRKSVHVRVRGLCFAGTGAIAGKFSMCVRCILATTKPGSCIGSIFQSYRKLIQVKAGLGMGC